MRLFPFPPNLRPTRTSLGGGVSKFCLEAALSFQTFGMTMAPGTLDLILQKIVNVNGNAKVHGEVKQNFKVSILCATM